MFKAEGTGCPVVPRQQFVGHILGTKNKATEVGGINPVQKTKLEKFLKKIEIERYF